MILAILAASVAVAVSPPVVTENTPNLYRQPAHCRSVVEQEVARQQVALKGRAVGMQYAVLRKLDGCAVPTPLGYHPAADEPAAAARREDAPSSTR
jgi:hypothetical protein